MERGERWLSLVIFFSFLRINFRGRRDSHESHLPLFGTIYFPTAPSFQYVDSLEMPPYSAFSRAWITASMALIRA